MELTMNVKTISREITELPPEGQKQVLDFVFFLKTRFQAEKTAAQKESVLNAPFIGMWKDRKDIPDGITWVRKVREEQWLRHA